MVLFCVKLMISRQHNKVSSILLPLVERLKTKARDLLRRKDLFNRDKISCSVDIED